MFASVHGVLNPTMLEQSVYSLTEMFVIFTLKFYHDTIHFILLPDNVFRFLGV